MASERSADGAMPSETPSPSRCAGREPPPPVAKDGSALSSPMFRRRPVTRPTARAQGPASGGIPAFRMSRAAFGRSTRGEDASETPWRQPAVPPASRSRESRDSVKHHRPSSSRDRWAGRWQATPRRDHGRGFTGLCLSVPPAAGRGEGPSDAIRGHESVTGPNWLRTVFRK